ncbi:MAG TPA: phosphatase PAP2 family protein [Victivallales bacterium]|nr:phosphatase PAP2 family protein [Victivallales bacterium]
MMKSKVMLIYTTVFAILCAIFYLFLDLPIDKLIHNDISQKNWLYEIGKFLGKWGDPKNIVYLVVLLAVIACFLWIIKKKKIANNLSFIVICCFIAFLITEILKFLLARYRPEVYFETGKYGFHFLSHKHAFNSFPSGHASMNFVFVLAITNLIKQRWLICLLILYGCIAAASRVVITAHYPSDVLAGIYVAILAKFIANSIYSRK